VDRPILLNARAASRPELGGVERWARELAARLPDLRPGVYTVVRPPGRLVHRLGHAWEQVVLPARAARARASLVLNPANLAPVAWPRNVVVIHDAATLRHPEFYARPYVAWQRAVLPAIARRALHVITVSEFSRREIVELLAVAPEQTSVVSGGVDARFSPRADPEPARQALGLERPYVLTVGSRIARKNLGVLDLAARRLGKQGIELVAAGGGRPQLRSEGAVSGVRPLGLVPDEHLPGLYAGARAFVLPSRYEGFGLTCLEAMATGVPVVAADRAALPEVCGPAALLVDPDDRDALAAALERAVADGELRERLVAAGMERAAGLTWQRTATEVDAVVRRVQTLSRS
jgi:glycosyltransferase involved in cell wall biosynthesis